jgi:hypothetical protein
MSRLCNRQQYVHCGILHNHCLQQVKSAWQLFCLLPEFVVICLARMLCGLASRIAQPFFLRMAGACVSSSNSCCALVAVSRLHVEGALCLALCSEHKWLSQGSKHRPAYAMKLRFSC